MNNYEIDYDDNEDHRNRAENAPHDYSWDRRQRAYPSLGRFAVGFRYLTSRFYLAGVADFRLRVV